MLKKAQGNLRATWGIINEVLNKKKAKPIKISQIRRNEKRYVKDIDIANAFNKFFTSVGPGLAENVPASKSNFRDWMKIPATIELRFNHVSSFSMLDHLYKLDGADDIPIYLLKNVGEYVYEPLTSIYNTCIDSCTCPDSLKIAKVIPLFKDGDRELASNYRPISLLPTISKIYEKLICDSLVYHLEINHLLFAYQFGFSKSEIQH